MGNPNSKFNPTFQAVFEIIIFFTSESKNAIFFLKNRVFLKKIAKLIFVIKNDGYEKVDFLETYFIFKDMKFQKVDFESKESAFSKK